MKTIAQFLINLFAPYEIHAHGIIKYAWSFKSALKMMEGKEFIHYAEIRDGYFGTLMAIRKKIRRGEAPDNRRQTELLQGEYYQVIPKKSSINSLHF